MANRYPIPMKNEVYERGDILLVAYNRDPAPMMPSSDYARITIYNCLPHLEKKNLLECTEMGDPCHSFVVDEEAVWDQRNWQMPPDTQELWAAYDPAGEMWNLIPCADREYVHTRLRISISPDYEVIGFRIRKVIVALASEMIVEEVQLPKRRSPAKKKKKSQKKKPSRKSDI
jgi:hypothetical protein